MGELLAAIGSIPTVCPRYTATAWVASASPDAGVVPIGKASDRCRENLRAQFQIEFQ